jgi:hypothetical protein
MRENSYDVVNKYKILLANTSVYREIHWFNIAENVPLSITLQSKFNVSPQTKTATNEAFE